MRTQTQSLMPALGEEFRNAREARGLSLSDVAEQIHIRSVYLAQIEKENWSAIGAPVYVRGFLRTYARFLGIDAEQAVGKFNETSAAGTPLSNASSPALANPQASGFSAVLWIAGIIAAVLVAFVIYNLYTLSRAHRAVSVHRPTAGRSVPSASHPHQARRPPAAVKPRQTLWLRFGAASWVRVTIDGNVRMEGTFPSGTVKKFRGKRANVRVGNAGGVDVTVNGKHVGKLGALGNVAERTFTLQE